MAHFNHKLSFLTLLLFFLWNTAKADEKTFSTTNGLSTNQTLQIVELPNGQILVETEGVFNLFDGMQFYTQEYNLENRRWIGQRLDKHSEEGKVQKEKKR